MGRPTRGPYPYLEGRIAGDPDACGDLKRLLAEKEEWRQRYGDAEDEIERLRRELNLLKAVHESAEAEVRQLRAALQEIKVLSWTTPEGHHIQDIARRALEGK